MTSLAVIIAASLQVHGTDIPRHFWKDGLGDYSGCLRSHENVAKEPFKGRDPDAPTLVQFTQLMAYCALERSRAVSSLRTFIRARNPDWSPERVDESVEFVISGQELKILVDGRRPDVAVHDSYPPPAQF